VIGLPVEVISILENNDIFVIDSSDSSSETGNIMNFDSGDMMNGNGNMMNGNMNGDMNGDGSMMNGDIMNGNGNMMNGNTMNGNMNGDMNGDGSMMNGHNHRHGMFMCIAISLLFFSLALCCCCGPRARLPDEEDYVPVRQFTTQSEEQLLEMVQRQSLSEYQQQQARFSAPEGMGYMRVPVMSPEAYAQYLAAASAPRDV